MTALIGNVASAVTSAESIHNRLLLSPAAADATAATTAATTTTTAPQRARQYLDHNGRIAAKLQSITSVCVA